MAVVVRRSLSEIMATIHKPPGNNSKHPNACQKELQPSRRPQKLPATDQRPTGNNNYPQSMLVVPQSGHNNCTKNFPQYFSIGTKLSPTQLSPCQISHAPPPPSRTCPLQPQPNGWAINPPICTWRNLSPKGEHIRTPGSTDRHTHLAFMAHTPRTSVQERAFWTPQAVVFDFNALTLQVDDGPKTRAFFFVGDTKVHDEWRRLNELLIQYQIQLDGISSVPHKPGKKVSLVCPLRTPRSWRA